MAVIACTDLVNVKDGLIVFVVSVWVHFILGLLQLPLHYIS
jgi:hypothetical protein